MIRKFGVSGIDNQPQGLDFGFGSSNIKSKQSGTVDIFQQGSTYITISAVDTAKAIIRVSYYISSDLNAGSCTPIIQFSSSTQISIGVDFPNGHILVFWEVIEFNNVKSVQTGLGSSPSLGLYNATISAVNTSKSMVFFNFYFGIAQTYPRYMFARAYLTSTTNLEIRGGDGNVNIQSRWWVVEFL